MHVRLRGRWALPLLLIPSLAAPTFAQEDAQEERAHFHHVRLNVTDPEATLDFYQRFLGAVEVSYRGLKPALFTERSFLLLNKVEEPARSGPKTAISHIGWAGIDGPNEYEWLESQGVEFQTPVTPLGTNHFMYLYGPDHELIEIFTGGKHHRFDHVHLWASDIAASARWFGDHLGFDTRVLAEPKTRNKNDLGSLWMAFLQADNVNLVFFGRPDFESDWWPGSNYSKEEGPKGALEPTLGSVVDRLGFSYSDIDRVYERMKAAGVEIVEEIKTRDYGFRSFLVLAPDDLLIEIVEEKHLPEGLWD